MSENFVNSKNNKNDCNVEYCSGMGNKEKVLELLHTDCRISLEQMATMLDIPAAEVADIIDTMEKDGVILGYGARINVTRLTGRVPLPLILSCALRPSATAALTELPREYISSPRLRQSTL